jgi:hypothetical protein
VIVGDAKLDWHDFLNPPWRGNVETRVTVPVVGLAVVQILPANPDRLLAGFLYTETADVVAVMPGRPDLAHGFVIPPYGHGFLFNVRDHLSLPTLPFWAIGDAANLSLMVIEVIAAR